MYTVYPVIIPHGDLLQIYDILLYYFAISQNFPFFVKALDGYPPDGKSDGIFARIILILQKASAEPKIGNFDLGAFEIQPKNSKNFENLKESNISK